MTLNSPLSTFLFGIYRKEHMGTEFIPPDFLEPHYSTKSWRGYYFYLKRFYSESLFEDICKSLGMPLRYLLGDDNWVSNSFLSAFLEELKRRTGDEDIALKAGKFSLRKDVVNPFEYTFIKNMGPFLFLCSVPSHFSKMNLINKCRSSKISPGHFILTVEPTGDIKAHPDACKNTAGAFLGIQDLYELNFLDVQHTKCIHNNDQACVYEIRYKSINYWKKQLLGLSLTTCALFLAIFFLAPSSIFKEPTTAISLVSFIVGAFYFSRYRGLIKHFQRYYEESREKNQEIYEGKKKLDRRYQESNLLRDLSLRLVRFNNSKDVINSCLDDLQKRFGYAKSLAMLVSSDNQSLYVESLNGFSKESEFLFSLKVKYPADSENPHFFSNILGRGETTFLQDISKFKSDLKTKNRELIDFLGISSLIVAPIQDSEKKYGLLIVGSVNTDLPLTDDDRHLVDNVARMLSMFFQNAKNFEKEKTLRNLFQKYVPPVVLESVNILESERQGFLTPKNNAVTSMFVDLRGFTTLSEQMQPEKVIDMLNIYAEYITKEIAIEGGIVDNIIGDGIVGFFPASETRRTAHAERAIASAVSILSKLEQLQAAFESKGYPRPCLGVGIHSGNATVGNIGSDLKLNYTAIGDTVNLASRLQDLCKEFQTSTPSASMGLAIISDEALKRAKFSSNAKDLGELTVRGRKQPVRAFMIDVEMAKQMLNEGAAKAQQTEIIDEESRNQTFSGLEKRRNRKAS